MGERKRVLIVDDDPHARLTTASLLETEGYDLYLFSNGREAIDRVEELDPDAILLDVMMPGMDGFEVCQVLKSSPEWQHIPITLVTALDSEEDLVRGLDAGADDFLSKPVRGAELRARVRSMVRIKERHDTAMAMLRLREDLANMIVHDMRSPLTAIIGLSHLLESKLSDPDVLEDVKRIQAVADRLSVFVDDILTLAKLEQDTMVLHRSPTNVNQLASMAQQSHSVNFRAKRIDIIAELPEELRLVSLDENLFSRVLDNLLSNALKFSPEGSRVTLRVAYPNPASRSDHLVRVQVLDQGPGVPEDSRDRIFEKFDIVDMRRHGVAQIGLGLAFCKLVVEAHGGRIFAGANEPRGTVFTVDI
jgi:two-component system sensor histidine kinase/response regulator